MSDPETPDPPPAACLPGEEPLIDLDTFIAATRALVAPRRDTPQDR